MTRHVCDFCGTALHLCEILDSSTAVNVRVVREHSRFVAYSEEQYSLLFFKLAKMLGE